MTKVQLSRELSTAQRLLAQLDCPRALTISILLKYEQVGDILSLRARPEDYSGAADFDRAYQATRLLQKSQWLETGIDKRSAALESFWAAESECRRTNEVFGSLIKGECCIADPEIFAALLRAKNKIRSILRPYSPYRFLDYGGFGPGSDSDTRSGFTAAYNKLEKPGSVTRECSIFLDFLASNSSLAKLFTWDITLKSISCRRIMGNRVTFVPKDARKDRTIAVEPRWNVFFQKGMGKILRMALQRAGTDLDDQSRNQELARIGSLTGEYATLDLKSASDTISRELIRFLLPERWALVLDRLRSRYFSLSGEWHLSEKWSSMGNGYTFELESLVFHALISSITEDFSVYGDDLIVPSGKADEVVALLRACGFELNSEKSFVAGPFRESCGADYFNGVLVTPIYWKDPLHDEGTLRLVNQISRLAYRWGGYHSRDRRFYDIWRDLVSRLPKHFRYRCPTSISSGVHDVQSTWAKRAKWGWDGWRCRVALPQSLVFSYKHLDAAILSHFFSPSTDGYSVRDRIRWRLGTIFIPSGYEEIGPWL